MKLKEIKEYYKNGNLDRHCYENENGLMQGEYRSWWDNGQLFLFLIFKDGKKHGLSKAWCSNGKTCSIINNINGNRFGISIQYE